MKIIAVENEVNALKTLKESIEMAAPYAELSVFSNMEEMKAFAESAECDIAFLGTDPDRDAALKSAAKLKELHPNINIIFVTENPEISIDAMKMHASGVVLKPVTHEKIQWELEDLRHPVSKTTLLRAQCFGNFDIFTSGGEPIRFSRTKSKELLAILISKKGTACTIKELTSILFEAAGDDEKKKDYTQQLISAMLRKFRQLGIEKVINKSYNSISVNVDYIDCDYYRFNEDEPASLKGYCGEFMAQYSWAEHVNGYLETAMRKMAV